MGGTRAVGDDDARAAIEMGRRTQIEAGLAERHRAEPLHDTWLAR